MRKLFFFSVAGVFFVSGCGTAWFSKAEPRDFSRFAYARVFCTPDNESQFETVTVALSKTNAAPPASPLYVGGNRPVSTALFVGAEAQWGTHDLQNRLNHPAPAAQFVVVVAGTFSVTTTDGDTRRFSPGDVVRVEDAAPCKGHITVVGDKPIFVMFAR